MNPFYDSSAKHGNDIQLNRGDILDRERRQSDHEEQLIQARKDILSLCAYIQSLEKQLHRHFALNPSLYESNVNHEGANVDENEKQQISEMAQLMNNSTLIKSYEQMMTQFEVDFEKKNALISAMERDLQQIQFENQSLASQLYNLKSNVSPKKESDGHPLFEKGASQDKDQLVELLKRNHDIVLEKYEIQRQRNEGLEKNSFEKDKLYNEIKIENDGLSNSNYKLQRQFEDLVNEKRILETKLKNVDAQLKATSEECRGFKIASEKYEGQAKMMGDELQMLQKNFQELALKKQNDIELLTSEMNILIVKEQELNQRIHYLQKESNEVKDQLRMVSQEVDARTRENDHLVSLIEDFEQKTSLYEQKEKSIMQLASESKKRIEDSNSERDRALLKEQQYLRQIQRLEERIKSEAAERQERSEKILESLRAKHKNTIDQKEDEISEIKLQLSDIRESNDKHRVERDSLRIQLDKLQDQVRGLKDEASFKYETYSKQLNQTETTNEEKFRQVSRDNERLKEEAENLRKQSSSQQIILQESEVKLDRYMRDYERYFDENKRLRELTNSLREEKDTALGEIKRLKSIYHDRVQELNDECNLKIAHAENQILEMRERNRFQEEKSFEIMMMQERISEKWKNEHRVTVEQFDRVVKNLKIENRHLHDKIVELKGQIRIDKENSDDNRRASAFEEKSEKKRSSKSRERERERDRGDRDEVKKSKSSKRQ